MYKDHATLMHELKDYASPKARLTRMIRSGEVIQVRRGIFLPGDETDYSVKSLAGVIYGPSYISFEYALGYYNLIPEKVEAVTSATYNKNKNRTFHTPIGSFYYYYLPPSVYPYEITRREENGQPFLIAAPEKALCDTLYKTRGITTMQDLSSFLVDDRRMEPEDLAALHVEKVAFLAPLYRKKTITLFAEWLKGEAANE